jgi:hypothetical protein
VKKLPLVPRLRAVWSYEGDALVCESTLLDERRELVHRERFTITDPTHPLAAVQALLLSATAAAGVRAGNVEPLPVEPAPEAPEPAPEPLTVEPAPATPEEEQALFAEPEEAAPAPLEVEPAPATPEEEDALFQGPE